MGRRAPRAGRWAALLLGLLLVLPALAAPPVPLLWKVSDADNAVYLLGSFHLLRPDDYPLAAEVQAAFDDAEAVVFELPPEEMGSPAVASGMARAAQRRRPGTLREDLGPGLWSRLEAYAGPNGLPLAQLSQVEPWYVGLVVTLASMQRQGLDPALGLDRHLMEAAVRAGKPTAGLERAEQQIAVLAGMAPAEQVQMLAQALEQAEEGPDLVDGLHAAWREGDDARLWREMGEPLRRGYPDLYARVNVDRNNAWLPQIERHLARDRGDTLVVVGALHLLGDDGVVELLRAKGYRVERVCDACAARRAGPRT